MFEFILTLAAILAGAIAAVSGFGIGSLLTPVLATQVGTKLAVAAVAIPHVVGTAVRFWLLRKEIDRRLLLSFGLMSAAGGLAGALIQARASSPALSIVLGALLIFAGVAGLSGLSAKMRFHGAVAWIAGALSGLLGGLVGNQGGIRSAAMFGFDVRKEAFIATATAVALLVDGARLPVYLATQGAEIAALRGPLLLAIGGVVGGTFLGIYLLRRVPERVFRALVSALLIALGGYMLWLGGH